MLFNSNLLLNSDPVEHLFPGLQDLASSFVLSEHQRMHEGHEQGNIPLQPHLAVVLAYWGISPQPV